MKVYYTCKNCEFEMEVWVTSDEDDLPEHCPECSAKIPEIAHSEVDESARSKASDFYEET